MSPPAVILESLLARFRTRSFERLERIDAGWIALIRGTAPPGVEQGVFRDMHSLRGEAGVVGAKDVVLLARHLEDLLFVARDRGYRVHDDVDIVVTMAIQFIGILLRKRADTPQAGIDIDGFLRQIEEILATQLRQSSRAPPLRASETPRLSPGAVTGSMSRDLRQRFAVAATTVYVEHLRAAGASRDRLRGVWNVLSSAIAEMEAAPLAPLVEQHAAAATSLARELGKRAIVVCDAGEVHAGTEVLDVISTAVLHACRNAVDHGIESPADRVRAGKPEEATIRISARSEAAEIVVTVEDDGAGIDLGRVRDRAVELGVVTPEAAAKASQEQLVQLVFAPRMSTRAVAGDVSGRGIGLDAVRSEVESQGGTVTLDTQAGKRTRVSIRVPQDQLKTDVLLIGSGGARFAVPTTWSSEEGDESRSVDVFALLGLPVPEHQGAPRRALRLVRKQRTWTLWVQEGPRAAQALRVCPTPPREPLEIVLVDGAEAVFLRLEAFEGGT